MKCRKKHESNRMRIFLCLLLLVLTLSGCSEKDVEKAASHALDSMATIQDVQKRLGIGSDAASVPQNGVLTEDGLLSLENIPAFSNIPFVSLNGNVPEFTDRDLTTESFEFYSDLDSLGRCGVTYACIGQDLMPKEKREDISQVKPTGWKQQQYDFVDGKSLYNRCHLIGFQLAGENANEKNLITGTRYMNVDGMLPFENMVADYVKETNQHVLYRVTPIFEGNNLVANGVQMEAMSVEDKGESILFNVFVYNNQPGVEIDYATGENRLSSASAAAPASSSDRGTYVLNTKSKKFHLPDCPGASQTNSDNRQEYVGSRENLLEQGYTPCGQCQP